MMKKNRSRALRGGISLLFSFLLSLVFLGLTALTAIQWGCFSRGVFYRNMAAYDYYGFVESDFYEEAENYTLPTGLALSTLDGIIESYEIYRDVNGYIDAAFQKTAYTPDLASLKKRLKENIAVFFKEEGITDRSASENSESVEEFLEAVETIYLETVKMPLLDYLMKAKAVYQKILVPGLILLLILTGLLIVLIFRLHHYPHRALRYLSYSAGGAALMAGILPEAVLLSGFYRRIHLEPEYFYNFAMRYVENLLITCLYLAGAWLIMMIICILLTTILKKKETGRAPQRGFI